MLEREKYLDAGELAQLLRAARTSTLLHGRRDYVFLATLANTGIRPGEAVALTVADCRVTDHDGFLRVRRLKSRRELGRLDDVMLSRPLCRLLRRHVVSLVGRCPPPPAASHVHAFPFTVRQAERIFHVYRAAAALPEHLRLYALRHTFLTRAAEISRDPFLVRALAGHAHLSSTQIYTHTDPARVRELVERAGAVL